MSPYLCRQISLFHRHFRVFVRNRVDLRRFFAQQSRLTASWIFRTKEAQKARKSPKIAYFCSALPCKVICVAAQCRHAYSCNKIGRELSISTFLDLARFLRYQGGLAYLVVLVLKSAHEAFLGLTRGYLRQKEKKY